MRAHLVADLKISKRIACAVDLGDRYARAKLARLTALPEDWDWIRPSLFDNTHLAAIPGRIGIRNVLVGNVDQGLLRAQRPRRRFE